MIAEATATKISRRLPIGANIANPGIPLCTTPGIFRTASERITP